MSAEGQALTTVNTAHQGEALERRCPLLPLMTTTNETSATSIQTSLLHLHSETLRMSSTRGLPQWRKTSGSPVELLAWNLTGKLNFESQIVHQKLQVAGVIFVCFCFVWGPHHVFKLCELVVNI